MLEVWKEPLISKLPQSDSEEDRDITTARRASGEKTNQHGYTDNKENIDDQESEEKEPRRAKPTAGDMCKANRKQREQMRSETVGTISEISSRLQPHRILSQSDTGCHCDVQGVMIHNRKPHTVPESPRTDAVAQQGYWSDLRADTGTIIKPRQRTQSLAKKFGFSLDTM